VESRQQRLNVGGPRRTSAHVNSAVFKTVCGALLRRPGWVRFPSIPAKSVVNDSQDDSHSGGRRHALTDGGGSSRTVLVQAVANATEAFPIRPLRAGQSAFRFGAALRPVPGCPYAPLFKWIRIRRADSISRLIPAQPRLSRHFCDHFRDQVALTQAVDLQNKARGSNPSALAISFECKPQLRISHNLIGQLRGHTRFLCANIDANI